MTKDEAKEVLKLLEHLKELAEVDKILTTFIPAFTQKVLAKEGRDFLHGSFNLGGTISGRLSSSDPNLQQIPSTGTKYAKAIKKCFQAPKGWLMVGADYSSLEDRISALQTKDPNKLKVYTDGLDGHCLRAYAYFKDQMPDIDPNSIESINSIEKKYPKLRQKSKTPTFALQYAGTYRTLMQNSGFPENEARRIEAEFHRLYTKADDWVQKRLVEASRRGYARLAFGLRLRMPLASQTVLGSSKRPYEAIKEGKSVGNALTQSYGLLTTRAANEFMERVWASKWAESVLPIAQIHDAIYLLVKNNIDCLKWVNDNLIECMLWNKLPEIQHDVVKLQAKLEIYYPSWANKIPIPNGLSEFQIVQIIKEALNAQKRS